MRVATTTDSWERRYTDDLLSQVQILAGAVDSTQSVVRVAYAVKSTRPPARLQGGEVRVRASVLGFDGSVTGLVDTVGPLTEAVGTADHSYLYGLVTVPVLPGRQTIRVGLEQGIGGVVSLRDTVDVPAPAGPQLGLSDIAIGARSVPLWWLTGAADTVWVNPVGEFHNSEPISVYYEASGLVPDSSYKIELVIKPAGGVSFFKRLLGIFGGGGAPVRLETTMRATGAHQVVLREIGVEKLKPASYVLEVTISSHSSPKVTRHQEFTVVK